MLLLLVEDEIAVADLLADALTAIGHVLDHVVSGESALERLAERAYDAVIVDRGLPGIDGIGLIRAMRAADVATPVLIVSALGAVDDRVAGLRAGGDDYLVKPYHLEELEARLEALVRRSRDDSQPTRLAVGDLELDLLSREARRGERRIELTPREFRLLECLMRSAGQVVTRKALLEDVWGYRFDPQTNVIDVHVSRLRQALGDDAAAPLLGTVRGSGYVLSPPSRGRDA